MEIRAKGINTVLVEGAKLLLKTGSYRKTRGQVCLEFPEPVMIVISNPRSRVLTIAERRWNPFLPYIESLWISSGQNLIDMPGHYVKKVGEFSDDGLYMRAGYGPRFRFFNGSRYDYRISALHNSKESTIDQLLFVIKQLRKDPFSRRAIISIGDPNKDCFSLNGSVKETKDFPCTRSLQFIQQEDGTLDLIVSMRSNDLIWGASAVNIFNFSFIQEYIAGILGLEIGKYYHFAANLHVYERHFKLLNDLASVENYVEDTSFEYSCPQSWDTFLVELDKLVKAESMLRVGMKPEYQTTFTFFEEWYNTLAAFGGETEELIRSPHLKKVVSMKLSKFL